MDGTYGSDQAGSTCVCRQYLIGDVTQSDYKFQNERHQRKNKEVGMSYSTVQYSASHVAVLCAI